MKRLEGRMAEVADLKYHIIRYSKTRETYQKYPQAKDKAALYLEHAEKTAQHEAAKKDFVLFTTGSKRGPGHTRISLRH